MKNKEFEQKVEKYLKRQFGITIAQASKRQVYEALMSTVREKHLRRNSLTNKN